MERVRQLGVVGKMTELNTHYKNIGFLVYLCVCVCNYMFGCGCAQASVKRSSPGGIQMNSDGSPAVCCALIQFLCVVLCADTVSLCCFVR